MENTTEITQGSMPRWLAMNNTSFVPVWIGLALPLVSVIPSGVTGWLIYGLMVLGPIVFCYTTASGWKPVIVSAVMLLVVIGVNPGSGWWQTVQLVLNLAALFAVVASIPLLLRREKLQRMQGAREFFHAAGRTGGDPFVVELVEPRGSKTTVNGWFWGDDVTQNLTVWGRVAPGCALLLSTDRRVLAWHNLPDLVEYTRMAALNGVDASELYVA